MIPKKTILIVDDEDQICRLLDITLSAEGYQVIKSQNGQDALLQSASRNPDLLLLDLGLPDMDGLEVLQDLRDWYQKPVIILSVRNSEQDIVEALDHGANDYLTKPFRTGELMARIRASLRSNDISSNESVLKFKSLTVDLARHTVLKNGVPVKLTSTEFSLIALLAKNHGRVMTHQYILNEIWGHKYSTQTQYLRVYIAQLRKKIEDDPSAPEFIMTESGIGYRFSEYYEMDDPSAL
ncbi:MAG: response regulator [Bacteroidota bacterium]